MQTEKVIKPVLDDQGSVVFVGWTPDGRIVSKTYRDGVSLWNPAVNKPVVIRKEFDGPLVSIGKLYHADIALTPDSIDTIVVIPVRAIAGLFDWTPSPGDDPGGTLSPRDSEEATTRLRRMIFDGTTVINPNPELSGSGGYSYDGWLLGLPPEERPIGPADGEKGLHERPASLPGWRHPLERVTWVSQPAPIP